jgi:hypothetical protein
MKGLVCQGNRSNDQGPYNPIIELMTTTGAKPFFAYMLYTMF